MERYQTAFYEPMIADWSNFGTWSERGGIDASRRATAKWQSLLETSAGPDIDAERVEALNAFIARRTEEGGAPPVS
jgi:trimethylamine--corrinoid protein Co-methyltransferase